MSSTDISHCVVSQWELLVIDSFAEFMFNHSFYVVLCHFMSFPLFQFLVPSVLKAAVAVTFHSFGCCIQSFLGSLLGYPLSLVGLWLH